MESSERARPDDADDTRADAGTDPLNAGHEGDLPGTNTSVRAHWRIDAVDGSVASTPDAPASEAVALVQLRLRNPAPVAQRVSVQNALDGPVLFPRRRGVPEAGWDREGFVGVVAAESERALGYACPAPIQTPPIALRRAADGEIDGQSSEFAADGSTPAAVVRTYGDSAPPAAVAHDAGCTGSDRAGRDAQRQPGTAESAPGSGDTGPVREAKHTAPESDVPSTSASTPSASASTPSAARPPSAVTTWLDEVEDGIARAEGLDDATVPAATAILAESGGLDPALDDTDQLAATAARLRSLAERANELAARADAVEVPERALRRLA